jgi:hypothetical protein
MNEREIPLEPIPVIDKTDGYRILPDSDSGRCTGNISFECHYIENEAPAYVVRAWGLPVFPEKGPAWLGTLSPPSPS